MIARRRIHLIATLVGAAWLSFLMALTLTAAHLLAPDRHPVALGVLIFFLVALPISYRGNRPD